MPSRPGWRHALMLSLLILSLNPTPALALTYLVGAGPVPAECDFNDLQDAVIAAANNPGVDFIRVANDQPYTQMALNIGQQDLTITGGYASCTAALPAEAAPTGLTLLDGAGGALAPVLSITGSGVRVLESLQIRNGDNVQVNGSGCGGGIRFNGRGELLLRNTGVAQNDANSGGGICFTGTAAPTALTLASGTAINNNNALTGHGGGIHIGGSARLLALQDNLLIAFNNALNGDGGGIHLAAPARSDIGSPGVGNTGVLYGNSARRGGAFALVANEGGPGDTCARFFSTSSSRPVRIQQNRASDVGGAFYLRSDFESEGLGYIRSTANAVLYDFVLDGNTAPNGPVAFLNGDDDFLGVVHSGSLLLLNINAASSSCEGALADLGRQPCTASGVCNRIEENRAEDFNGQATNGNLVELRFNSDLHAHGIRITGNQTTRLVSWSSGNIGFVHFERCLLADNVLDQEIFRGFHDGIFRMRNCTIAGNQIGAPALLRHDDGDAEFDLHNLMISQPGRNTIAHPSVGLDTVTNQWIVASEVASLRPDPTVYIAPARFIDPQGGDYRLRIGSEAVDFVPLPTPSQPGDRDLDGRPRNVDLGDDHANLRGRDAGAFERQLDDPWLVNGDFVSDLRQWNNPDPAHATWNGSFNAPDSVGGSLQFSVPAEQVGPNERRTALSQCFNVPAPGEYQIVGRALVVGTATVSDYPAAVWRLRYASEDCSGAVDATGERFFGRSSSSWQPLTAPLMIPVDASLWNWNTTIEVRLDVAQNQSAPTATALVARFDEIEILRTPTGPLLFRDGFETVPHSRAGR